MQLFRYFNELDEKNITKYIKLNSSKHLIISSEYFSCISYDLNKIFFLKKIILKLGYEPIVIFLGRNYISFFNSLYREVLKQNKSLEYKDNIIEYLKKIKKYGYYFYNKNNRYYLSQNYYYKNVLRVSNQIIDSMGISDIYRGGATHVMAFLTNMDKIYEKFVQRLFEEYYVHPKQVNRQIPRDAWKTNEFTDKKMYQDIIITELNSTSGISN